MIDAWSLLASSHPITHMSEHVPISPQDLLREVGLGYLLQRRGGLDAVEDWADSLSLGEQQRLAFARLFCRSPAFAIMDVSL